MIKRTDVVENTILEALTDPDITLDREYAERLLGEFAEEKAGQHETIVNCPKPFTAEFLTYLLVNALRNLNEAQRHNLAISLAVRDPLFSIEEYEEQLGN